MKERKESKEFSEINNKEDLLQASKISLVLNSYEDIFSDFDPRLYDVRSLSHDFLQEAKVAVRGKSFEKIELRFLVPNNLRNLKTEATIKKRLKEHFRKHYFLLETEKKTIRRNGLRFAFFGVIFGILATYFSFYMANIFTRSALIILLEPASWFLIWTGFDYIFLAPKLKKQEIDFYKRMSQAEIGFQGR